MQHRPQLRLEPLARHGHGRLLRARRVVEHHRQRRHVLPHQQAQLVGPVVPAHRLHLDVLAHAVEPERLDAFQVEPQCLVGGGGVDAVGPVTLVERRVEEHRPVVEQDAPWPVALGVHAHGAQRCVARHLVEHGTVVAHHPHGHVVEVGVVGAPQQRVGYVEAQPLTGVAARGRHLLPSGGGHLHGHGHLPVRARDVRHEVETVQVGLHVELGDVDVRDRLKPHGLPDSRTTRVEDAAGPVGLLADRERAPVALVVGANQHFLLGVGSQHVGDVHGERRVAALVAGERLVVDPDGGGLVHRPEVQQYPACAPLGRHVEGAVVPHALVTTSDPRQP